MLKILQQEQPKEKGTYSSSQVWKEMAHHSRENTAVSREGVEAEGWLVTLDLYLGRRK